LLSYDPDTGLLTWIVDRGRIQKGDIAGRKVNGYLQIGIDYKVYMAQHLAWFLMTGEWPRRVDHRDRVRSNNRWSNLRKATRAENAWNRVAGKNNALKAKGIIKTPDGRYRVRIMAYGVRTELGTFNTLAAAKLRYAKAATARHGEFATC